jgi:hypothetical protein
MRCAWRDGYVVFAFARVVARFGFERELEVARERREVRVLPLATAPVGSLGSPAATLSFWAISAISSGA